MNQQHLLDRRTLCALLGGSRPLNPATIYRLIKKGVLPAPIKVGASSRWLRSEVEACLQAMIGGRS
jgi:predicted DNA-binding transcriptional regulator AlpA